MPGLLCLFVLVDCRQDLAELNSGLDEANARLQACQVRPKPRYPLNSYAGTI
jgi:hypothetical protein